LKDPCGPCYYFWVSIWADDSPLSNSMDIFINKVFRSLIIFFFAWGSYDLVGTDTVLWGEYKRKMRMDNILISFFSRV
jgi:hypothetical protein